MSCSCKKMYKYAKRKGDVNKYPKNAIISIYIGFSFCFQKQGAFNLLFLLTTLKNRVVLSKSLFEAVKGP